MASSVTIRRYVLLIMIVCTVILSCTSGNDDYEPEVGPIGKYPSHEGVGEDHGHEGHGEDQGYDGGAEDGGHEGAGEDHGHEGHGEDEGYEGGAEDGGHDGVGEDHGHEGSDGHDEGLGGAVHGNDPAHIVDGALLCFHEKHIYSSCDEACRLTSSGDLHVPSDQVDEFCNGPCLEETNLVLECLDGIMEHFLFYNRATTQDVRDTILAGCGHGDHRGDFDVGEHIEEAEEGSGSIGSEPRNHMLSVILITVIWHILVL